MKMGLNDYKYLAGFLIGIIVFSFAFTMFVPKPECDQCSTPKYDDCFMTMEVEKGGYLIPILFKQPMSNTKIELKDGYKTTTCEILEDRCKSEYYSSTCEWEPIEKNCRCYVNSREMVNKNDTIFMN